MYCKKCGAQVNAADKFCPKCGLQNPAPVYSAASSNYAPKLAPKVNKPAAKKKFPGWLIIAAIAVVVILIIASSSSGSSGLEKNLIETLPIEIRTYILDNDYYMYLDSQNEEELSDRSEKILEVKDLTVDRHSTEGKSDTADCTIVMEDDYIKKIAYVTLYSVEYDTGWVVESWEETSEAVVELKYEPDTEYLKSIFSYNNINVIEDNLSVENGYYIYKFSVNDSYKYLDVTGEITVEAKKYSTYSYGKELHIYGWDCDYQSDIKTDWKIEGIWTVGFSESDLENVKGILTVSNIDNPKVDSLGVFDERISGNYTGNASFNNPSYGWVNDSDYSDNSGTYFMEGIISDPKSFCLKIGDYYFGDENHFELIFTADTVKASIDYTLFEAVECGYINYDA